MRIKFDWLDILLISQYLFVIYKGDSNSFLIFNQWSFDIFSKINPLSHLATGRVYLYS